MGYDSVIQVPDLKMLSIAPPSHAPSMLHNPRTPAWAGMTEMHGTNCGMSVATHGQSGFGLGFNAIVLHREGYQADLTRARVRGYARYIEPLGF